MSRPLILARSPFFATIDETVSKGSKVELFVWKQGESEPSVPNYVFQKPIPSPSNHRMNYDLSSYIQEYFTYVHPYTDIVSNTWWCNVRVKTYNLNSSSIYDLIDDDYYYAINGYQNIEINGLNQGFVNIPFCLNSNVFLSQETNYVYGQFQPLYFVNCEDYVITWSAGETGGILTIPSDDPYCFAYDFEIFPTWTENINIQISGEALNIIWQFRRDDDCNYNGVLWYLNCNGVWESTNTKGTIKSSVNTTSNEYQFIDTTTWTSSVHNAFGSTFGEKQQFNTNGTRTIQVNTNWKPESWNLILEQIMLSEHLYFNDVNNKVFIGTNPYPFPYKLNTKNIQLNRHLTDKLINYQLELELLQSMVYTQY